MESKKKYNPKNEVHELSEPMSSYGFTDYFSLASQNITKTYIQKILSITRLTVSEIIELIPVSIDTYKRKTTFKPEVTEKVLEIEEVYRVGLEAFGEGFYDWMNNENIALGGRKPKELLSNSFGIRTLINQIGRMQHGVLA